MPKKSEINNEVIENTEVEELTQEEKAMEKTFAKQEKTMKQILAAEKKVKIFIPENPLNPNEVVPVSLNGVTYAIPTGQEFEVPESIYKVWKYAYDKTREANKRAEHLLTKEITVY